MPQSKKNQNSESDLDAIEFLEEQHREVEELFAELESTGERAAKSKGQLVQKLALAIESHAQIEEKIFYPEARDIEEDMTLEAYEEHNLVRYALSRLQETATNDEYFMTRATVLKELIMHHVEEEEGEYFPKVRKKLGKKRLAELGTELQAMYEQVQEELQKDVGESPRKSPSPTAHT